MLAKADVENRSDGNPCQVVVLTSLAPYKPAPGPGLRVGIRISVSRWSNILRQRISENFSLARLILSILYMKPLHPLLKLHIISVSVSICLSVRHRSFGPFHPFSQFIGLRNPPSWLTWKANGFNQCNLSSVRNLEYLQFSRSQRFCLSQR